MWRMMEYRDAQRIRGFRPMDGMDILNEKGQSYRAWDAYDAIKTLLGNSPSKLIDQHIGKPGLFTYRCFMNHDHPMVLDVGEQRHDGIGPVYGSSAGVGSFRIKGASSEASVLCDLQMNRDGKNPAMWTDFSEARMDMTTPNEMPIQGVAYFVMRGAEVYVAYAREGYLLRTTFASTVSMTQIHIIPLKEAIVREAFVSDVGVPVGCRL